MQDVERRTHFSSRCEIVDESKMDNDNRCKDPSRRLHMRTSCRPGHPVNRADPCCTFRYRTGTRWLLRTKSGREYLWNPRRY